MREVLFKICNKKKGAYTNLDAVDKVLRYILDKSKRDQDGDNIYGRIGTISKNTDDIIKDFKRTKRLYHREDGVQIKHIIITFGIRPKLSAKRMRKLIMKTVAYFGQNYQLVYAVHEKVFNNYHIHIGINSVSIHGKKFNFKNSDIKDFKRSFNRLWRKYGYEMSLDWNKKRPEGKSLFYSQEYINAHKA